MEPKCYTIWWREKIVGLLKCAQSPSPSASSSDALVIWVWCKYVGRIDWCCRRNPGSGDWGWWWLRWWWWWWWEAKPHCLRGKPNIGCCKLRCKVFSTCGRNGSGKVPLRARWPASPLWSHFTLSTLCAPVFKVCCFFCYLYLLSFF